MKNNILIVLLVVIGLLFLQRECSRPSGDISIPTINVTWEYDSVRVVDSIPYPEPYEVITTLWDTVYKYRDVDTAAILRDYFTIKVYEDTLVNTSDLLVTLKDSVHQNRLWGERVVNYKNFRPVDAEIDVECPEIRNKWFIGGTVLGTKTKFGAGPAFGLVTKRDNLYTYSYDVINNTHNASMYWKISFK